MKPSVQPIETFSVGVRGLPDNVGDAHAVRSDLFEFGCREVDDDVGSDVVRGIVDFVEHLLLHGHQVDRAAGARHLGEHGGTVRLDFDDRKGQVPRFRDILESGIGEIAAGDLRAALHQMAEAVAGAETRMVQRIPTEFVHHRRHEDGRIGDAAGHDDLRALLERFDDRLRAEIDFGGNQAARSGTKSVCRSPGSCR